MALLGRSSTIAPDEPAYPSECRGPSPHWTWPQYSRRCWRAPPPAFPATGDQRPAHRKRNSCCCLLRLSSSSEEVDHLRYHAPHFKVGAWVNLDGGIVGVLWHQPQGTPNLVEPLNGQVSIQHRNDDAVMGCCNGPVHNQQITAVDASANHGIAADPDKEGGGRMGDEVAV